MLLNRFGLAVCTPLVGISMIGSSVGHGGAVMLHRQNYNETVSIGIAATPQLPHVYVATANSPGWSGINGGAHVESFRSPPLKDGFAGSFVLDATAADRSEFAARILDFQKHPQRKSKRLYLGLGTAPDSTEDNNPLRSDVTIGTLDTPVDGSRIAFVRFDINEWEVSDGVVSYNIDVSYWGRQASTELAENTMMAMEAH